MGDSKGGDFDIPASVARPLISAPVNPNSRPNTDVVRPWVNGADVNQRRRQMWIIDFGVDMPGRDAALYELPYEYVRRHVKPERDKTTERRTAIGGGSTWNRGQPCGRRLPASIATSARRATPNTGYSPG